MRANIKIKTNPKTLLALLGLMIIVATTSQAQFTFAAPPPGASSAPYTVSYSGRLTSAGGTAITVPTSLRFSLWSDNDFDAADLMPDGSINVASVGYAGWNETHTVTPDSTGLFHVRLGTIVTLPNFTAATQVYLQVEAKASGLPDTSYECLDPDGNNANLTDRYPLDSSAFTINADTVDNYDVGTGANQLPPTDGAGLLPISSIPGGTNADNFVLDNDNTVPAGGPGAVKLQFGNLLGKYLEYDAAATWFNFNDDVNITGDLTVTGTINGTIIGPGAPNSEDMIFNPQYPGSVIYRDGTNNKGTLDIDYNSATRFNYYEWSTLQPSQQDIDLRFQYSLPPDFATTGDFVFFYRTQNLISTDNKIEVTIIDVTDMTVCGSSLNNVGIGPSTGTITAATLNAGCPGLSSGDIMEAAITLYSRQDAGIERWARIGRMQHNYSH